jgi:hypothetical protein
MRKVRCVSPHGGCHNGMRADNGLPAHPGYGGPLALPPNEGGHVVNAVLGYVAVGAVVDAPEAPAFIADGFHFVDAATGEADVCGRPGEGCWCGGAHHAQPEPEPDGQEDEGPLTLSPPAAGLPPASAVVPDTTGGV